MSEGSLKHWKLMSAMWSVLESLQKKVHSLPLFVAESTFYQKYKHKSQAILNNFLSLAEALAVSHSYEVPLMEIVITSPSQEQFVNKYMLDCFENSQLLNQSFILWVHFMDQNGPTLEQEPAGEIRFHYQESSHKSVRIEDLPRSEEQIEEVLTKMRAEFYFAAGREQRHAQPRPGTLKTERNSRGGQNAGHEAQSQGDPQPQQSKQGPLSDLGKLLQKDREPDPRRSELLRQNHCATSEGVEERYTQQVAHLDYQNQD